MRQRRVVLSVLLFANACATCNQVQNDDDDDDGDDVTVIQQALTGCHTPFGGTARAIPGTIQAEDYD